MGKSLGFNLVKNIYNLCKKVLYIENKLYIYSIIKQTKTMKTRNYLTNLISEKAGISMDTICEVAGKEWGMNYIPLSIVVDTICNMDANNQNKCVSNLTAIDFKNGDVMHFFNYIAKFIAK